jgi:predicted MFS family arabinose efflux permease
VNAFPAILAVLAGLAGSIQVAIMARLGDRVGVFGALAFATALTALSACALLLITRHSFDGYSAAFRQPKWLWLASLMIPVSTRAAASATVVAVGENDVRAAGNGLRMLIEAGAGHLDPASSAELSELLKELETTDQTNR